MRFMIIAACLLVTGCHGPLSKPMVDRLDDETQQKVDGVWLNMFTTPDNLDRTLLLDVILSGQLHQYGVDHLRLVSEKYVGDGLVVMEVRFDREDPAFDEFSVSYIDSMGHEIRRERFAREEVEGELYFLFSPEEVTDDMDAETRMTTELRIAEREARFEEIQAILAPLQEDDNLPDEDGEME
ncbi:MAG: hypothetical protein ABIG44_13275 [Planctomycetota bacterium]